MYYVIIACYVNNGADSLRPRGREETRGEAGARGEGAMAGR